MPHRVVCPGWSALVIILVLAACGHGRPATTDSSMRAAMAGEGARSRADAPSNSAAATQQGAPDTVATATAALPAAAPAAASAPGCPTLTPAVIAAGRKIFTGAGNCFTCHGANAAGTAMAPTLHAHQWLNISGSYASIVQLVTNGVPHPKQHPAPMPPKGGAALSESQVCAVGGYVYALSRPAAGAVAAAARARVTDSAGEAAPAPPARRRAAAPSVTIQLPNATAAARGDTVTASNSDLNVQITIRGNVDRYTYTFSAKPVAAESTAAGLAPAAPAKAAAPAARDTAAAVPPPVAATPAGGPAQPPAGCPAIAPAVVSEGRRIFTGAGNCQACHGPNAQGTPMAPNLHAHAWIQIDGSYASIVGLVTRGVPNPKQHAEMMPPMGGASLRPAQVCAVAAYVYSLSH